MEHLKPDYMSEWKLQSIEEKGLYILTLDGPEGQDKVYLDQEELSKLKLLLNSMEIPLPNNELPL